MAGLFVVLFAAALINSSILPRRLEQRIDLLAHPEDQPDSLEGPQPGSV